MPAKRHRAQVKVLDPHSGQDLRDSATFDTKREADAWKARRRQELIEGLSRESKGRVTLQQAFDRYISEVAEGHRGRRWDKIRLQHFMRDPAMPVTLPLAKLTAAHFTHWKNERLKEVSPGTVLRDFNLLGSVFSYCRRDWGWMDHNPLELVRKPPQPKHRERVITRTEIKTMLRQLEHRHGHRPQSFKQMVAVAFLLALRTGMRAGEIVGLEWSRVHGAWASLQETKNGTARDVPLSVKAQRLMQTLRGLDEDRPLPIRGPTLDATFRTARKACGLSGFTFHDSRHTAATRIGATVGQPGRLSFPEFCKMFGWRDPKYALVYVNPSAASLAAKL